MRRPDNKSLILAAVMTVATLLLTWLIRVDIVISEQTAGYWTMGDVGVYLSAALLGGPWGALCAAVASALADIIVGQAIYAPASLILKAAMALLCARLLKRGRDWAQLARTIGICGVVMVLGYFFYDLVIRGNYLIAALGLPFNLLQVLASGLVTVPVLKLLGGPSYEEKGAAFGPTSTNKRQLK